MQEEEDAITSLIMTRPDRIPTTELPDFTKKPERPDIGERPEEEAPTEDVTDEEVLKKKIKKPKRPKKRPTEGEVSETPADDQDQKREGSEAPSEEGPEEKTTAVELVSDLTTTDEVGDKPYPIICKLSTNNRLFESDVKNITPRSCCK